MVLQKTHSSKEFKGTQNLQMLWSNHRPRTDHMVAGSGSAETFCFCLHEVPETFLKTPLFRCGFPSLYQLGELFLPEVVTGLNMWLSQKAGQVSLHLKRTLEPRCNGWEPMSLSPFTALHCTQRLSGTSRTLNLHCTQRLSGTSCTLNQETWSCFVA